MAILTLPSRQHWLALVPLANALFAAIGVAMGLIQLWPQIRWWDVPLGIAALVVLWLLWRAVAQQQADATLAEQRMEDLPKRFLNLVLETPGARAAIRAAIDRVDSASDAETQQALAYEATATVPAVVASLLFRPTWPPTSPSGQLTYGPDELPQPKSGGGKA